MGIRQKWWHMVAPWHDIMYVQHHLQASTVWWWQLGANLLYWIYPSMIITPCLCVCLTPATPEPLWGWDILVWVQSGGLVPVTQWGSYWHKQVYICNICRSVHHMHVVPTKIRRGHHIPWDLNCRWLWSTLWVLELNPGPAEEGLIPLTTETSLQLLKAGFKL